MLGLKAAFRTLLKTPFVSAIAILSLALGIGANAAIFSLFDEMLLRSLPVPDPHRLVNLGAPGPKPGSQSCNQAGDCEQVFSYLMFRDLQAAQTSFTGIAAHVTIPANLSYAGQTENGQGMLVSGSYFQVLGLQPAAGRLFTRDDDGNIGGHFVVVLSYDYWANRLGSDPSVMDGTLIVNGQPLTVVGVAPQGFTGTTLGNRPDVFVPLSMRALMLPGWEGFDDRRSYWAYLFARLRQDATIDQARAELNTLYQGIVNEVEAPLQEGMSDQTMERFRAKEILLRPGHQGQSSLHAEARTPLLLLLSITGLVLLIACANIANLLLAKGAHRGPEIAMRASLGASRGKLFGQLMTESVVLAALGGLASLLVAFWTLNFIGSLLPPEAQNMVTVELSFPVIVFAGVLSIGTGIIFGLYPALHSTRTDLVTILKSNSGQPAGARSAARFRTALVTAQIALSMALLTSAGLFIKSLSNVTRIDLGLSTENVVTFSISPQLNGYEFDEAKDLFIRTEAELAAIPGVLNVSSSMVPILTGNNWGTSVSVEGFESGPDIDSNARLNIVGPGYLETLGMELLAGRDFTEADAGDSVNVAVINEAFARKFGIDPRQAVGKRMSRSGGDNLEIEIVGIVRDAKYSEVKQEVPPLFFTPYRQYSQIGQMSFYARTGVDPASIMAAARQVVKNLDPDLPVENLNTLERVVTEDVFLDRMISTLSAAFATLATILAAIGLYGVLAYSVAQRTKEIGLRMALGAAAPKVRKMVLMQVGRMMVIGGIVGVLAALGLGKGAQSLLFEMQGNDPFVTVLAAVLLTAVALGAGFIPAWRASKVDPMKALRYE